MLNLAVKPSDPNNESALWNAADVGMHRIIRQCIARRQYRKLRRIICRQTPGSPQTRLLQHVSRGTRNHRILPTY